MSENSASLGIVVPLNVLTKKYVRIPLLKSDASITSVMYDGEPICLNQKNGQVYFELAGQTSGLLELNSTVPVMEKGGVKEFSIGTSLLRGGVAELVFGDDIKSVRLYGTAWQKREGQKVRAALDGSEILRCELATFVRKKESADETGKRVKKMYSTTYTLASLEEEVATD
ncbi:MAG: hypothetical protein GY765_26385, partial [bacterium]|nr:hypothetical protein [bacterium]